METKAQFDQELDETFGLYFPEPTGRGLVGYGPGGEPIYSAEFAAEADRIGQAEAEERRESLRRYIAYNDQED